MQILSKYKNLAGQIVGRDCSKARFGSLVRSEFRDDCDINKIMARFTKTGLITHLNTAQAAFADVSELGDYTAIHNRLLAAQEAFMSLPAHIRKDMDHDPSKFEAYLADPENADKLLKAGLLVQAQVEPQDESLLSSEADPASPKGAVEGA